MSVASSVTATLVESSGHGRGGNKSPSPQGAKNKELMETDNNDLGHLQHSLELDNVADDLPHSSFVLIDHDLALEGEEMSAQFCCRSDLPSRKTAICCQDSCFLVRQRRIARRVSQSLAQFRRALLGGH